MGGSITRRFAGIEHSLACWVALLPLSALAAPLPEGDILLDRSARLERLLHRIPSGRSLNHLFEHFFLPSVFALEESAGFSDVDPELLSIDGSSPFWTAFYLDELNLSDPWLSGSAAFKVPFAMLTEVELRYAESPHHAALGGPRLGIRGPDQRRPARVAATISTPQVGDIVPWAKPVMRALSGNHPRDRTPPPPDDRRQLKERQRLSLVDEETVFDSRLRFGLELDRSARHYLDFPSFERPGAFDEATTRTTGAAVLTPKDQRIALYLLAEHRRRGNLFAERGYSQAETLDLDSGGFLLGVVTDTAHAGLTFKHYRLEPNVRNFSRELIDPDGEGLFPFQPPGRLSALRLEAGVTQGPLYLRTDLRLLAFSPQERSVHPLTFAGQPYGQLERRSLPTLAGIGEHRAGFLGREALGLFEWSYEGYLAISHAGPSLLLFDAGLETSLRWRLSERFEPFLLLAKTPVPLSAEAALLLSPTYLEATERLSSGQRVRTLGGRFTRVDPGLTGTNTYAAAIGFESQLGAGWRLAAQGIGKAFGHTLRLALDGPDSLYGTWVDGAFYYGGGETRFLLTNTKSQETAVYFAGQIQLQKVTKSSFLVVSFAVLNAIGFPPPLNGPFGNDVGVLDFSSADPNARINARAALDPDRAFLSRLTAGLEIFDRLWAALSIAHRDGEPFAFYSYQVHDGQVARSLSSTRGSPFKYTRPFSGPREDFRLNVDVELNYRVPVRGAELFLSLVGANLFDFGNEINEVNDFSVNAGRAALETQLPRSLVLTVELSEGG